MSGKMKSFLIIFVILSMSIISFAVELELLSHPQNADVFIDEVWRGNTPLVVDLSPGNHTIKVNKNGYQSKEETLDIRMPTVIEYNLIPLEEIAEEFPLVLYLTNYQQSGSRRILFRENEDQLIEALQKRFENMGFSVSVEKPIDEFDLIMDNISVYGMLSQRHPEARLFMIVNALWSYSSFREKKITRLETQFRIYDPKTSITLGNYQDISESIGILGTEITILQAVEKATQNFLDNIGNYMVERIRKDVKRPILAFSETYQESQLYLLKSDNEINDTKLYDKDENLIETQNIALDKIPASVIFLVDRSGSNEKELPLITSQIESLIQTLPEGFEWSLMGFDDKIEIIQGFTNDYIQWEFAKDQIVSSGMTRLYDAIYNAATVLARRPGVKILFLLTDGVDSDYYDTGLGSIRTEEEALNAINRSGMIVYPIGVSEENHESLLKRIAYLSATEYYDINDYQQNDLSNNIIKDLTYTIAAVSAAKNKNPEYFSINSYKFEKETDSRFLNQKSLIRDFDTNNEVEKQSEQISQVQEDVINETREPTPVKSEEVSSETLDKQEEINQTDTSKKVESPSEPVVNNEKKTEEVTKQPEEVQVEGSDTSVQTTQKKQDSVSEETTSQKDENEQITTTEEPEEAQITVSEDAIENIVDFPKDFNQILTLKDIDIFDLDINGNLIWAQNDILYFYVPNDDRIAGISFSSGLKKISFHYPYLSILFEKELKILEIKKDRIVEISSINIDLPLAFFKLINEETVILCFEDGMVQACSIQLGIKNEWKLESGVLNQATMDEMGRIILSTTTARVGWLENIDDELNMMKIEKPIVGLCPFDVDQERFLIVDASGSVYFQRFESTKPTIRNLNRGIVLKASFAEANNMLFANHWDKTLRGYRIFDLNETVLFRSKKGIDSFDVDTNANKVLIVTVDNELYFYSKNSTIPENLEKIYTVEKSESTTPSIETTDKTTDQEQIEQKETSKTTEEKTDETNSGYYDTSINLSDIKKEDTQKSSEMDKPVEEKKEEEIAIVLDGKVIVGDVDEKADSPIPTGQKTERELTTEELQGFEAIYGGWKSAVAYKDYGYILAGDSNMRIVNPLLQTIKNISYSRSNLLDSAISKYNVLALLFDNRIEIWDIDNLYSTKDISKISSYKFPISDGKEIVFSRSGDYLLLLRNNGELKIMTIDFTRGKNIFSKNEITAINTDLNEGEQFLFGDSMGNVGYIGKEGIISSKNVSESAILEVFSHKGKSYWIDENSTVGILGGIQRRITSEIINAVYPADIDKDWILFGTDKGNLYICDSTLKQTGKTSLPNAVLDLSGYKENMISIDAAYNLKSWNLIAGSEISNKPNFTSPHAMFSEKNKLSIIMQDNTLFTYSPNSDALEKKNLADETFIISDVLKNPTVIHNEGKKYYPFSDGKLSDYAIEVFKSGNTNSSERYFIYWDRDMLSIFDIENSKTVRTFKFGDGNDINFASVRKDRLFFFFNQSMGITNPYNPGQLVVIDLKNEGLSEIKRVFLIEGTKLGIIDSNGKIIYYMLLEDRITLPIELGKPIDSTIFDDKNYQLIAKSSNELIVFSALDNDITEYRFSNGIEDFTFTEQGLYVLAENGTIWYK